MPKTKFRPAFDGFNFANDWSLNDAEIALVQQTIKSYAPAAAAIVAPILAPAFMSAAAAAQGPLDFFGSLIGIPPGALEGLEPIAAGLALGYVKDNLDTWMADALRGLHGFCGGMSFTPVDYFNFNWLIQKGTGTTTGGVPEDETAEAKTLRNYVFQRHLDSWQAGGVAQTMLEWMAALFLVPDSLGGGSGGLFDRTKDEWKQLRDHIDNDGPWPIALVFDSKDPSDQHQVAAYGYNDDDPNNVVMYVYDSNVPNTEITITLKLATQQLAMDDPTGNYKHALRGVFCANYFLSQPPVSVGLSESLTADPDCGRINDPTINMSLTAVNKGFRDSGSLTLRISSQNGEHFVDPAHAVEAAIPYNGSLTISIAKAFETAGLRILRPDCLLKAGVATDDGSGGTFDVTKTLPPVTAGISSVAVLRIFPPLEIQIVAQGDHGCMTDGVAGKSVTFAVGNVAVFGGSTMFGPQMDLSQLTYEWSTSAGTPGVTDQPTFVVSALPTAGSQVTVNVKITDPDGCYAVGTHTLTTLSEDVANLKYRACVLMHKLQEEEQRIPSTLPQGPGDASDWIAKLPAIKIQQLAAAATRLGAIAKDLKTVQEQLHSRANDH